MPERKEPGFQPPANKAEEDAYSRYQREKENFPEFWEKTRATFERMDPERAKEILTELGLVDQPEEIYRRDNYRHDLYMEHPAGAGSTFEGIVAYQWMEGQQAADHDCLSVDLLVAGEGDEPCYKQDPEKSPHWKKYQEVLEALREQGVKKFVPEDVE